jgi:uncharacterized protein (TIGR00730 family)
MQNSFKSFLITVKNVIRLFGQLIYGVYKIYRLPQPIVTIFGGARIGLTDSRALLAHQLTHRLLQENISVITGGGAGIMQAAGCALADEHTKNPYKAKTLAITVKTLLTTDPLNKCVRDYMVIDYFFARKWLMINFSRACAFFPGGFGTIDELFEVLVLLQTKSMQSVPVVLIGRDYWQPLVDFLYQRTLKDALIKENDLKLMHITDSIEEALCLLIEHCKACSFDIAHFPESKN